MVVDGILAKPYSVTWNTYTSDWSTSASTVINYNKWFNNYSDDGYPSATYTGTWSNTTSDTYIINTSTTSTSDWVVRSPAGWAIKYNSDYSYRPKTAREKLQEIIQARITPAIHTQRQPVSISQDPREVKAHDTLRLLIGLQRYRQFLKNGYVTIHSQQNGKTYKVYPGTKFTHVYDHGQREQDLCIYLAHDFPPTDQLIAKILLIQTDPNHYHRIANKFHPCQRAVAAQPVSVLSLPEIYKELKRTRVA
jgi:hypothetical protein